MYCPPAVDETLESLTYVASPPGYERGWRGPYLEETPIDPWKKEYFYRLVYGVVFGPTIFLRSTPPKYQNISFDASPGTAKLVMDNFGLTACSVLLNGTEILTESEFTSKEPHVKKQVALLSSNILSVRARSNKSAYVLLSITSPFSKNTGCIIGSYGSDNKPGGDSFSRNLTWVAGQPGIEF